MERISSSCAAVAAVLCLATVAPSCKKDVKRSPLPLGQVELAQSASQTRLPPAGTLVFVEQPNLRVAGSFVDDCPAGAPPCTAEYRFFPSSEAPIPLPGPPMGDAAFLSTPEGTRAVELRRKGLSSLTASFKTLAASEEAVRADAGAPSGNALLLAMPASAPSWIAYDVLYTATRAGFASVAFLVQSSKGHAVVSPTLPARPVGVTTEHLIVTLDTRGIELRTPAGNIGPACDGFGPGVTLANLPGGKPDLAGLTACAQKTRAATPALGETAEVRPFVNTPFASLVAALDALQRNPDGSPLFTDLRLHSAKTGAVAIPAPGGSSPVPAGSK